LCSDMFSSPRSLEHDAVFSSADVSGAGCPSALFCRRFARPGFLLHLRSLRLRPEILPSEIPSIRLTGAAGEHPWWTSTNVPGSRSDDVVMADGNPAGGPSANG
jgi:hypothetical protein